MTTQKLRSRRACASASFRLYFSNHPASTPTATPQDTHSGHRQRPPTAATDSAPIQAAAPPSTSTVHRTRRLGAADAAWQSRIKTPRYPPNVSPADSLDCEILVAPILSSAALCSEQPECTSRSTMSPHQYSPTLGAARLGLRWGPNKRWPPTTTTTSFAKASPSPIR